MKLVDVYQEPLAYRVLWNLLCERDESVNISHKELPTYADHSDFIDSFPYPYWYLIHDDGFVGSVYLTDLREVGIFILKKHQNKGYATKAIDLLRETHPGKLLANINPENEKSITLFNKLGFKHIQNTYEL